VWSRAPAAGALTKNRNKGSNGGGGPLMKSSDIPSSSSGAKASFDASSLRFFWKSTSFSDSFFFSSVTCACPP